MKNYEKYADKIKNYDGTGFCIDFIKPIILKSNSCSDISCQQCTLKQILWLDEECEEPEVDWSKVEVDTPIIVRDYNPDNWHKRYFAKFESGKVYAWCDGRTSWNSNKTKEWIYAKLVGQEESDE